MVLAFALSSATAAPRPAAPRANQTGKKPNLVHVTEVQRRLYASEAAAGMYIEFAQDSIPRAERISYRDVDTSKPSPFMRGIKRFWRPQDLHLDGFYVDRERYPARAPWSKPENGSGHFGEHEYFRAAALKTIARWADKDGFVDVDKVATRFATTRREQALFRALRDPVDPHAIFRAEHANLGDLHAYLDRRTLRMVTRDEVARLVPKDMHALSWVKRNYDKAGVGKQVTRVWARQHLLGNTLGFLEEMGLPAAKTEIWGKTYSLDPRIGSAMLDLGYHVHAGDLDPADVERQVAAEIAKIPDPKKIDKPRFLILDDGGELIQAIARVVREKYPAHAHLFAAVEQTQGGINRLEDKPLPFPVVASGSSWGKRTHGSAMFGHAVSREIESMLPELARRQHWNGSKRITVLGYGEIGGAVARHFKEAGFTVTVYDPDPSKLAQAAREGMVATADQPTALGASGILVSAAGRTAFKHDDFAYVPAGAVIVNAASSNELPRIGEANGGLPKPGESQYSNMHDISRALRLKDPKDGHEMYKGFTFVKNGGVINFPLDAGDPKAGQLVPGRYIQYQLGLLYLDVVHAMNGKLAPGFTQGPVTPQKALTKVVERQLAQTGESLDAPKWD